MWAQVSSIRADVLPGSLTQYPPEVLRGSTELPLVVFLLIGSRWGIAKYAAYCASGEHSKTCHLLGRIIRNYDTFLHSLDTKPAVIIAIIRNTEKGRYLILNSSQHKYTRKYFMFVLRRFLPPGLWTAGFSYQLSAHHKPTTRSTYMLGSCSWQQVLCQGSQKRVIHLIYNPRV